MLMVLAFMAKKNIKIPLSQTEKISKNKCLFLQKKDDYDVKYICKNYWI